MFDFDLQCSRRSAALADLHSFLHQPFDFLWINFMGINKGYSAVLLSVLTKSRESNTHRSNREWSEKPLIELPDSNGFLYQSSACLNLQPLPRSRCEEKAHFPCWPELMNICWMDNISKCLPGWCNIVFLLEGGFYESVSNLISTRMIYVSVINCCYPNGMRSLMRYWQVWKAEGEELSTVRKKTSRLILICLKSTYYWLKIIWCPCRPFFWPMGPF